MFIADTSKDSNMESDHYYLKPDEILEECLYGIGKIKALDQTERESEEDFTSSEEENDEGEESLNKVKKNTGTSLEISSDKEYHEKAPFNKVKKEGGGFKRKTEEKVIVISSDEDEEMVEVVRVSREDGSIGSLENDESDSLSDMIQGLESMSGNNNVRVDSKADLKDKVMKKSPLNPEVVLPYGWDKMKKEELMEEFLKLNQGKDIPEYLLENLREADYDEEENDDENDKKKLKEEIKKEKKIQKEMKKEKVKNKGKKKMDESEVRLHLT